MHPRIEKRATPLQLQQLVQVADWLESAATAAQGFDGRRRTELLTLESNCRCTCSLSDEQEQPPPFASPPRKLPMQPYPISKLASEAGVSIHVVRDHVLRRLVRGTRLRLTDIRFWRVRCVASFSAACMAHERNSRDQLL
jgi:hypothetical protein